MYEMYIGNPPEGASMSRSADTVRILDTDPECGSWIRILAGRHGYGSGMRNLDTDPEWVDLRRVELG